MSSLAPGTPCYLRRLTEYPDLEGRTVEIEGLVTVPDEPGDWYSLRADWAAVRFPDRRVLAPRRCLLPIVPPAPVLSASTKRFIETAGHS